MGPVEICVPVSQASIFPQSESHFDLTCMCVHTQPGSAFHKPGRLMQPRLCKLTLELDSVAH